MSHMLCSRVPTMLRYVMAPDSHTDSTIDDAATPAFSAASASMQNLLAQYFSKAESEFIERPTAKEHTSETNGTDNVVTLKSHRFDVQPDTALSSPQTQTRAIEAFAALLNYVSEIDESETHSPVDKGVDSAWPAPARNLIQSLREEISLLRDQLDQARREVIEAQEMADHDVLTPALNRRAFLREVHRAIADCRRYGEEACIIFIDMDNFKAINDTYGHAAGDAALVHTAKLLQASIREGDSVGRMGGDEFAVLLRHADLASAKLKAGRLETDLTAVPFEYDGLFLNTGGSFGVRAYAGQATAEIWLSEADAAMFLVKKSAR